MIRRRDFITLLGGAAAWPLIARAQQSSMAVIGYLSPRSAGDDPHLVVAFRRGLGETGYVEGRNAAIEYRWAEGYNDRLPGLAADLVRRQVNVIAAVAVPAATAAKAATTTIPTVFQAAADPIAAGLVTSLARPLGNLTGVTSLSVEVGPKRLELLHELMPTVTNIALLVNPTSPLVADVERPADRSPSSRASAPGPACEHGARDRRRLRDARSNADRRACDRPRSFFHYPKPAARHPNASLRVARHPP